MFGRKIVFTAILIYAAVMGCVVWPTGTGNAAAPDSGDTSPTLPVQGLVPIKGLTPFCGVAIQLQRVDWVKEYDATIDRIAADGADTVSLVVDARQENAESTEMYVDMRKTLTVPQLTEVILHAKSQKLRVVLMPIVLLDRPATDKEWRGTLNPTNWDEWFDSYRDMMEHYARIAQATNVDLLVVGSELVSTEKPEHLDQWIKTINDIRGIYKGPLTYSSNWDRYWEVPFWKYLDFVAMNSYWTLGDGAQSTVADIMGSDNSSSKDNWLAIQKQMFEFLETIHKPVILLEAGWCSLSNAATDPWDYTQTQLPVDNELQRRLYEAFFRSWWGKPELAGFMIWEMHPGGDPSGKGYTPEGKPAEQILRDWMNKPRWTVSVKQ